MKKSLLLIVSIIIVILFAISSPCPAIVALPDDAGINYKTMTVVDASKLRDRGMKKVKNGDKVTIRPAGDGGLLIIDNRTGEKIKWSL